MDNTILKNVQPVTKIGIRLSLLLVIVFFIFLGLLWNLGYRINTTKSVAQGVWKIHSKKVDLGDYVLFCPKNNDLSSRAYHLGYLQFGFCPGLYRPLIKRIVARPGDRIDVHNWIYVNHKKIVDSKILTKDSLGRDIPWKASSTHLNHHEYFAMATRIPNSFDSRYFGSIKKKQILGAAKPIWLWQ